MVYNKHKKNVRQRGSHTHGKGSKKKRRGAGNRGGRGLAGTGKRADQNKPSFWKSKYFSGPQFKSRKKKKATFSIADLEQSFENLSKQGFVAKNDSFFETDLSRLKVGKLLSQGKPTRQYRIVVGQASKKAVEKISAAKGEIISPKIKKENPETAKDKKKEEKKKPDSTAATKTETHKKKSSAKQVQKKVEANNESAKSEKKTVTKSESAVKKEPKEQNTSAKPESKK